MKCGNVGLTGSFDRSLDSGIPPAKVSSSGLLTIAEDHDTFPALLSPDVIRSPDDGTIKVGASTLGRNSDFLLAAASGAAPVHCQINLTIEGSNGDPVLDAKDLHEPIEPLHHGVPDATHAPAAMPTTRGRWNATLPGSKARFPAVVFENEKAFFPAQ
jgi:hypothetical protein